MCLCRLRYLHNRQKVSLGLETREAHLKAHELSGLERTGAACPR